MVFLVAGFLTPILNVNPVVATHDSTVDGCNSNGGTWQASTSTCSYSSTTTTPDCPVNSLISTSCKCGSTTWATGYCCSSSTAANGWHADTACTSSTSTCSSTNRYYCTTEATCTGAGGYWYASGSYCYSSASEAPFEIPNSS